jgi:hypothetical protein
MVSRSVHRQHHQRGIIMKVATAECGELFCGDLFEDAGANRVRSVGPRVQSCLHYPLLSELLSARFSRLGEAITSVMNKRQSPDRSWSVRSSYTAEANSPSTVPPPSSTTAAADDEGGSNARRVAEDPEKHRYGSGNPGQDQLKLEEADPQEAIARLRSRPGGRGRGGRGHRIAGCQGGRHDGSVTFGKGRAHPRPPLPGTLTVRQ